MMPDNKAPPFKKKDAPPDDKAKMQDNGEIEPDAEHEAEMQTPAKESGESPEKQIAEHVGPPPAMTGLVQSSTVQSLYEGLNAAVQALFGDSAPQLTYAGEGAIKPTKEPLPVDCWTELAMVGELIDGVSKTPMGEPLKPYVYDAKAAASEPEAMADTAGKLHQLAGDSKATEVIKKIRDAAASPEAQGPETPASTPPTPPM